MAFNMKKYRIKSFDGCDAFVVEVWHTFWPFWMMVGKWPVNVYTSVESAKRKIRKLKSA